MALSLASAGWKTSSTLIQSSEEFWIYHCLKPKKEGKLSRSNLNVYPSNYESVGLSCSWTEVTSFDCFIFDPDEAYDMHLQYAQAEDYPVDLYYLMDLSKSMEDDKDKLSELGNLLAERMQSITSNFRLGFGSFVDKVVMPYVSTVPAK